MLTEIHIEAPLVDEEQADQAWDAGEIDEAMALLAWWTVATASISNLRNYQQRNG